MKVLWPQHYWGADRAPELEGLGAGLEAEFVTRFAEVTDEQWRSCDALVGPSPPPEALAKLERCRIYVKPAVGFDDVDLGAWGERGIPVCNTPDYGTREVADHALALMLTLAKSIAFHDESLRADPKVNWRPVRDPMTYVARWRAIGVVVLALAIAPGAAMAASVGPPKEGGACRIVSGPNAGKSGTYNTSSDPGHTWCVVGGNATECGGSPDKCENARTPSAGKTPRPSVSGARAQ